jgi:glucokinase
MDRIEMEETVGVRMLTETFRRLDATEERVLQELCQHREVSEEAVCERLGIPALQLQEIFERFRQRGLLLAGTHAGRYLLNGELGYVVAVDMGATNVRYVVANLNGRILNTAKEKLTNTTGPGGAIEQIRKKVRELVESTGVPSQLRAIAIGVPSAVHPHTGLLVSPNNLPGWSTVDMSSVLKGEFNAPLLLDNDCNLAAVGEHWRGSAIHARNFVFLAIGTGIGSGVFIDGKLYQGRTGSAGEVYLMNVDWRLWSETFPDTGHVESYVSGVGIAEQGRKAGLLPPLNGPVVHNDDRDSRRVFAAMLRGDPRARTVIQDIFTVLGVTIANIISVLDPELIVLNGGLTKGDPNFLLETVNRVVRRIHADPPVVRFSALADKAQIYGATWAGLNLAYQNILQSSE